MSENGVGLDAPNTKLKSLVRELNHGVSRYVSIGILAMGIISGLLHFSWTFYQRFILHKRVSDAIAHVLQEPIRIHDWVTIKRTLQAFAMANEGALICLQLPGNIFVEQPTCKDARFKQYNIELSDNTFSVSVIIPTIDVTSWVGAPFILASILLILILFSYLKKFTSKIISDLHQLINRRSLNSFYYSELFDARTKIEAGHKLELEQSKLTAEAAIGAIAAQTAHDIRSPLAALGLIVSNLSDIEEDKRIIIRSSVNRINDIANQLLKKSRIGSDIPAEQTALGREALSEGLLPSIVDMLVSEKRIQYRDKQNIDIESDLTNAYGLFSKVNVVELQRVLSNLITNSVEALPEDTGKVTVSLSSLEESVYIEVTDTGRGLPDYIVKRVGEKGLSFGKSKSESGSGSGLGLYHAKNTVEKFGGNLEIASEINKGTRIVIKLPRVKPPSWFVEFIDISQVEMIVSLDDDISIHGIWIERIQKDPIVKGRVLHRGFTSGEDFKTWVRLNKTNRMLFLVDFELLNQASNGLDIIESLELQSQSFLVTSRFEEDLIRERCISSGIKLIPKCMASKVPFICKQPSRLPIKKACLIDDEDLNHMMWRMQAKRYGVQLISCKSIKDFDSALACSDIDFETPVYVDAELRDGVRGEVEAKRILELGFKKVVLATGYEASRFSHLKYLSAIQGKAPPVEWAMDVQ